MKNFLIGLVLFLIGDSIHAQSVDTLTSFLATLEIADFDGNTLLSLQAGNWSNTTGEQPTATLSTGEKLTVSASGGVTYFTIDFKDGSTTSYTFADGFDNAYFFEYDFGGEGVKELCYYWEFQGEYAYFGVVKYGVGTIKSIFEKDIANYKLVVDNESIEYYISNRLEQTWVFRKGNFRELKY